VFLTHQQLALDPRLSLATNLRIDTSIMSQTTNDAPNVDLSASSAPPIEPLAMSFPAILLNPRNKAGQIIRPGEGEGIKSTKLTTTLDGKTRGKRHIRRFDNGQGISVAGELYLRPC
jgi:hypothetical protein